MNIEDLFTKIQDANYIHAEDPFGPDSVFEFKKQVEIMLGINDQILPFGGGAILWKLHPGFQIPYKPEYGRVISNPDMFSIDGCECECCAKKR